MALDKDAVYTSETNPVKDAVQEFWGTAYYESGSVSCTRKDKTCEICSKTIPKGSAHTFHKFYAEDGGWPTFNVCSKCNKTYDKFINEMANGDYNDPD